MLKDITVLGIDLLMSITKISRRTLLRKYVLELRIIIKEPIRVMWLLMYNFIPPADDLMSLL